MNGWLEVARRSAIALALIASPACAHAQASEAVVPARAAEEWRTDLPRFAAVDVRADLDALYATLRRAHYDVFARTSRETFDRLHAELAATITDSMDAVEVSAVFQRFVAHGDVAHAQVPFPEAGFRAWVEAGGTLLPFDVRFDGDGVLIARSYGDVAELPIGSELLMVAGQPVRAWLAHAARYVSADRPYLRDALLELHLPRLLWLAGDRAPAVDVVFRDPAGERRAARIPALPAVDVLPARWSWQSAFMERRAEVLPDGIAYLRPGPFFDVEGGDAMYDASAFRTFVDTAFASFIEAGARDLIIDLRANPGGDNSFSDPLIAWFADRPFRFVSSYTLRASQETRASVTALLEQHPDLESLRRMDEVLSEVSDGERVDFEVSLVQPRSDGFEGRVWVLVGRHTYSNATAVAATIQDYGFGTIVGEETADLPTSYGSAAQFTLPRTGLRVVYPKGFLVRPSGDRALQGVVPDISLAAHGIAAADEADALLGELRRIIAGEAAGSTAPPDAPARR